MLLEDASEWRQTEIKFGFIFSGGGGLRKCRGRIRNGTL